MRKGVFKYCLAVLIGLVVHFSLLAFWTQSVEHNYFTNHIFECCAAQRWLRPVIYLHDIVVNILLSFLPAFLLVKINAGKLWLSVFLAVLPGLVISYGHILINPFSYGPLISYIYDLVAVVLSIPFAVFVIRKLGHEKKPTKLKT